MKSKWEGSDLIIGVPPARPSKGIGNIELPDQPRTSTAGGGEGAKPAKASAAKRVK
jgi:hypothetical protein